MSKSFLHHQSSFSSQTVTYSTTLSTRQKDNWYQMLVSDDSTDTFSLNNYNLFIPSSETKQLYGKYSKYNNGTWCKPFVSHYMFQNQNLPFIDRTSIPIFQISEKGVKTFPNTSETIIRNQTHVCYQSHPKTETHTVIIKYDPDTQYLTITDNNVVLVSCKASPYILLDIQAAGGNGAYGVGKKPSSGYGYVLGGGGGGGSGGFLSCSINLEHPITLTKDDKGNYSFVPFPSASYTVEVKAGGNGGTDNANKAGYGGSLVWYSSGSGGAVEAKDSLGDYIYVIDAIQGAAGGTGVEIEENGSALLHTAINNTYAAHSAKTINVSSKVSKTLSQKTGGRGEQSSTAKHIRGGGGGAASIVSPGGTYNSSTSYQTNTNIGAGGFGGTGWWDSSSSFGGGEGQVGGNGAVWIYYIPLTTTIYEDTFNFTQRDDGNYDVGLNKNITHSNLIEIPSKYNNKNIVGISKNGFSNITSINTIVLPETIIEIKDDAFYGCKALSKVFYGDMAGTTHSDTAIGSSNDYFDNATKYYRVLEHSNTGGNMWYYNHDGVPAVSKHDYQLISEQPAPTTCHDSLSNGYRRYQCKLCQAISTETLYKPSHRYDWMYDGETYAWIWKACTVCGKRSGEEGIGTFLYLNGNLYSTEALKDGGTTSITATWTIFEVPTSFDLEWTSSNLTYEQTTLEDYQVTYTIKHKAGTTGPIIFKLTLRYD